VRERAGFSPGWGRIGSGQTRGGALDWLGGARRSKLWRSLLPSGINPPDPGSGRGPRGRVQLAAAPRPVNPCAPVAQLDRASGFEPEGRGFESLPACH
jgi:hypothetical protein